MKVIPIPQTKRFNAAAFQQKPVHITPKMGYDTVSFGIAVEVVPSIDTLGNYKGEGYKHFKDFNVKGHSKADDLKVDKTLKTGSWLEANSLKAQIADIGDYAHITGKVIAERFTTGSFFEAGELDAQTAMIGESAKITGKAKATLLVAGNYLEAGELDAIFASIKKHAHITGKAKAESLWADGDLNIGSTDIGIIISRGDARFKDITRLNKLTIANNPTNPTKNLTRTLLFDSANIVPEKIKIVLGNIQELVIHTVDKNILKKLEFFHQDVAAEGGIGEKLLPEAIERLVKYI